MANTLKAEIQNNSLFHGVDIIDLLHFNRIAQNDTFSVMDIFTKIERDYCWAQHNRYLHLALCFAAKEAALKALGMGIPGIGIGHFFQDIEIIPDRFKPTITFYGWIKKICDKRRINRFFISLSASSQKAIALVVLSAFEGKIEKRTKNQ